MLFPRLLSGDPYQNEYEHHFGQEHFTHSFVRFNRWFYDNWIERNVRRVFVPSIQMMHEMGSKVGHLIPHHYQKIYSSELS